MVSTPTVLATRLQLRVQHTPPFPYSQASLVQTVAWFSDAVVHTTATAGFPSVIPVEGVDTDSIKTLSGVCVCVCVCGLVVLAPYQSLALTALCSSQVCVCVCATEGWSIP